MAHSYLPSVSTWVETPGKVATPGVEVCFLLFWKDLSPVGRAIALMASREGRASPLRLTTSILKELNSGRIEVIIITTRRLNLI